MGPLAISYAELLSKIDCWVITVESQIRDLDCSEVVIPLHRKRWAGLGLNHPLSTNALELRQTVIDKR